MNTPRRKSLSQIKTKLEELMSQLETYRDEEQECFDNMPEGLQASEKSSAIEEAAEKLSSACESLQEVLDFIEEAVQ